MPGLSEGVTTVGASSMTLRIYGPSNPINVGAYLTIVAHNSKAKDQPATKAIEIALLRLTAWNLGYTEVSDNGIFSFIFGPIGCVIVWGKCGIRGTTDMEEPIW